MKPPPIETFDLDINTQKLKALCARHDSDIFLADITTLLTRIDTPRIQIHPFQGLDSPMRQLLYMAALNLTSDPGLVESTVEVADNEWFEMVKYSIAVKAGYYDLLMPKEGEDNKAYHDLYKVAMPVFMDYYNTGSLNFEEQDIDRILSFFTPFDEKIKAFFGLTTSEFVDIYNLIDEELFLQLNEPLKLVRQDPEAAAFFDEMMKSDAHPFEWKYEGDNPNILQFLRHANTRSERFTVDAKKLQEKYAPEKTDIFLSHFTLSRKTDKLLFYTAPNPVLSNPIFKLSDGRYLVLSAKQLITAVYMKLTAFAINPENKIHEKFYDRRGKALQDKIAELFTRFSKKEAFIYNEYATSPNGDGQDILILWKSLAFIIEAKAGKEPEPMRSVKKSFEKILLGFKGNIQKGYEQTYRIKQLFDNKEKFKIYNKEGVFQYEVNSARYNEYFSLIVTLNKFRKPQIDLNLLLDLEETDDRYPFSVSIDDLENLILTMLKLKKGPGDFVRFLHLREQLQGRLDCHDELELWGAFFHVKHFKVPEDERMHFKTFPQMGEVYDELYRTGLGFTNEKNLERKKSGRYIHMGP